MNISAEKIVIAFAVSFSRNRLNLKNNRIAYAKAKAFKRKAVCQICE